MKVTIGQINTTPGDFDGNIRQILAGIDVSLNDESDLVVFPELAISGYLSKDLIYTADYAERNLSGVKQIVEYCNSAGFAGTVVFGYLDRNRSGSGKPFRNMAAVIQNGILVASYQKQLLPFYGVFDEGRYFEPGNELCVVTIKGQKYGICICEDVWNDKNIDNYYYKNNPIAKYKEIGVKKIISTNSSPYSYQKAEERFNMLRHVMAGVVPVTENTSFRLDNLTLGLDSLIYCNQIGGQDELFFDGGSCFFYKYGYELEKREVDSLGIFELKDSNPSYKTFDTNESLGEHLSSGWLCGQKGKNDTELFHVIRMGLKDYVEKSGFSKVIVASSGGIDSALVLCLACDVFGKKNVYGVRMPSSISSEHSSNDALELHKKLGCNDMIIPINHEGFTTEMLTWVKKGMFGDPNPVADENIQARLRGSIIMYLSNAYGLFPLTTGNKTELAIGYCTLYGDTNGGYAPISDLLKDQVYSVARNYAGVIPENIFKKNPSAELRENQTDENSLNVPYAVLNLIVKEYVENYVGEFDAFFNKVKDNPDTSVSAWCKNKDNAAHYNNVIRLINNSEFKRRQYAPGTKVSEVAFGIGRRLPIVKGKI